MKIKQFNSVKNNKSFDIFKNTHIKINTDKIKFLNNVKKSNNQIIDDSKKINKVKQLIQKELYNVDSKKLAIAMLNYINK